jgi:hypothetical protein
MKSFIDWNEVIPLLPKRTRDDLYLEAVSLLSQRDNDEERARRKGKKSTFPKDYKRSWKAENIKGTLVQSGRKFKILRNSKEGIKSDSNMGKVWTALVKSTNDVISIEGINSIAKGVGFERPQDAALYLWSRRFLEVSE